VRLVSPAAAPAAKADAWAARFGLDLDDAERKRVAAYLRRGRWWRTVGGTVSWPALTLLDAVAVRQLGATRDQGLEAAGRALAELPEEIRTGP